MAAATAVAISILRMTASSRNPGPGTNPAALTFPSVVDGSEAAIERTAQFGFVLTKSAALLQLKVVCVDSCNHAALLCAVAQSANLGPPFAPLQTIVGHVLARERKLSRPRPFTPRGRGSPHRRPGSQICVATGLAVHSDPWPVTFSPLAIESSRACAGLAVSRSQTSGLPLTCPADWAAEERSGLSLSSACLRQSHNLGCSK